MQLLDKTHTVFTAALNNMKYWILLRACINVEIESVPIIESVC